MKANRHRKVLVISFHPGDETLGCGGTLLKYKAAGYKVYCVFMTTESQQKIKSIQVVKKFYDFNDVFFMDTPESGQTDFSMDVVISKIKKIITSVKPNILLIPHINYQYSEGKGFFYKQIPFGEIIRHRYVEKFLMYEVIPGFFPPVDGTGNSFVPNVFVDISDTFREKVKIMMLYKSGIDADSLKESYKTLETYVLYRGNCIGVKYAESFMLLFLKESFAL